MENILTPWFISLNETTTFKNHKLLKSYIVSVFIERVDHNSDPAERMKQDAENVVNLTISKKDYLKLKSKIKTATP